MSTETVIWITIGIYLLLMIGLSVASSKSSKTLASFTVGNRNAGAWLTALSYGTAYFSAVMFIGYSGTSGWNFGGWAVLVGVGNAVFGSLLAWLVLANRTRTVSHHYHIKSMPQLFEIRYKSQHMKVFSAVIIFLFLIPYSASVYKGLTSVCSVLLGVDETITMIIIAAVTALLLIIGGYLATIKADFVQGIIMIVGIILLLFFVMRSDRIVSGGGISGLIEMTEGLNLGGKDWLALISTILMTSFGTWGLPQMIHKYYGIKDKREIKRGTVISTLFALLVAGGGYFIGSFGRMFFSSPDEVGGLDYIVPNILKMSSLPSVLLGVVLVLLISASVSTLSAITMSACSTLTMDLIKPRRVKTKQPSEKKMTLLIKILCLVFVALSYLVANTNTPILDMMSYSWGIISGSFLAPYMLALYFKSMTKVGAISGMITGFITAVIPAAAKVVTLINPADTGIFSTLAGYGPQFAVGAMILSFVVCIVVSIISKSAGADTNKEFYTETGI